ncbi:hypothetical protein SRHO_G00178670 [Serrasalmus rhombeus]
MRSLRTAPPLPLVFLLMTAGAFGTEWSVKYNQQEICALKGSTVFMNGTFTHPEGLTVKETFWSIDPVEGVEPTDLSKDPVYSGRVEFFTDKQKHFSLKLSDVVKKDEHQFCFRIKTNVEKEKWAGVPGVQLRVTGMCLSAVWIAVGGGSFVCLLLTVFICICRMKKRAPGTDNSETNQDDVLYTSVTPSTSRPVQAADSGAADVLYDEVTSTDQQGSYASVTFLRYTAATGCKRHNRNLKDFDYEVSLNRSPGIINQSFDLNADPNAKNDPYTALHPSARSSDDVYHTIAAAVMRSLRTAPPLPLVFLLMTAGAFGTEWSVKYNQQEICALKGSTVFMNGTFTHPEGLTVTETFWIIDPVPGVEPTDLSKDPVYSGRVEFFTDKQKHFSLKLSDVMKKDEHQFYFRIKTNVEKERWAGVPGVQLRVTALHVEAPEEVTEGQTVDLTCKTTCSLTDPTFIWYKNGCPLTTKTIKNNQLHLQPVSSEDAGSYSCAVRGSQHLHSTAHSLRVRFWIAVGGGSFVCLLLTVFICICRMKKRAPGTDNSETNQDDVLYTSVTPSTSRPAQAADSADSGAADVCCMHDTVRVQNDEVTSTDQQEEPQYASVTFLPHPAVTGCRKQNRSLKDCDYEVSLNRSPGIIDQSFDLVKYGCNYKTFSLDGNKTKAVRMMCLGGTCEEVVVLFEATELQFLNADPKAQDDTYTALHPSARSSDDVYHTLAVSVSSQILPLDL